MRWLLFIFIVISALEIGVFIMAGKLIGPWWVVVLIIITGILGVAIAKRQGFETWKKAQRSIANGRVPAAEIIDGICIFAGSVMLFAPGFITDIIGLLLIIPPTRYPFKIIIFNLIRRLMNKSTIVFRRW